MERSEYKQLAQMVHKQLNKYKVKDHEKDDFVQEVILYLMNRHGEIDIYSQYIFGDIKNGILNYLKKYNKDNNVLLVGDSLEYLKYECDDYSELEWSDLMSAYEYGDIFMDMYYYKLTVREASDKYGLDKNKIYYELNKIIKDLSWVKE